jgi:hypothetical protein
VLSARSAGALTEAEANLSAGGAKARAGRRRDQADQATQLVEAAIAFGGIDILINSSSSISTVDT